VSNDPLGIVAAQVSEAPVDTMTAASGHVPGLLEGAETSFAQAAAESWRPFLETALAFKNKGDRQVDSDEFEARFAVHGVSPDTSFELKPGQTISENTASVLSEYTRDMDMRARLLSHQPSGIVNNTTDFIAGLAGGLLTPQGLVFSLLPVGIVGKAGEYALAKVGMEGAGKALSMVLSSSFVGKTADAFLTGASISAFMSPLDYMDDSIRGQDMTFGDNARNILYGGLTMAGAHVAGEAIGGIARYLTGDVSVDTKRNVYEAEVNAIKGAPEGEIKAILAADPKAAAAKFEADNGRPLTDQELASSVNQAKAEIGPESVEAQNEAKQVEDKQLRQQELPLGMDKPAAESLSKAAQIVADPVTPVPEKTQKMLEGNEAIKSRVDPERLKAVNELEEKSKVAVAASKNLENCLVTYMGKAAGETVGSALTQSAEAGSPSGTAAKEVADETPTETEKAAAPEPVHQQPQSSYTEPKLPKELSKSSPRYGATIPHFESDLDKAAYIVSAKKQSKSHSKFTDWLDNHGIEADEVASRYKAVKDFIKNNAENADETGKLHVPDTRSNQR